MSKSQALDDIKDALRRDLTMDERTVASIAYDEGAHERPAVKLDHAHTIVLDRGIGSWDVRLGNYQLSAGLVWFEERGDVTRLVCEMPTTTAKMKNQELAKPLPVIPETPEALESLTQAARMLASAANEMTITLRSTREAKR